MCADKGDADGQFKYGTFLAAGRGVRVDVKKSARYLRMASDQGHSGARAKCFESEEGVVSDLQDSLKDFKTRADMGDASAQFDYGKCLEHGKGVSVDFRGAAHFYKLAADQGHADAEYRFGLFLANGTGIAADLQESARYYQLSADHGNVLGMLKYGACLERGTAMAVDFKEAAKYYKMAADQGDEDAQLHCDACLAKEAEAEMRDALEPSGLQDDVEEILDPGISGENPVHVRESRSEEGFMKEVAVDLDEISGDQVAAEQLVFENGADSQETGTICKIIADPDDVPVEVFFPLQ
jgi:TPR repeat protein